MNYHYSRKINLPFDEAVRQTILSLQQQGFGIITTVDLKETLKQKLNVDFRSYKILGACNPEFAHKAVRLDPHIGTLLPCNVVVQEDETRGVEVSAINPLETVGRLNAASGLNEIATEVTNRLRLAVDNVGVPARV
jgi:uncharacterized protein (DUF302 family)